MNKFELADAAYEGGDYSRSFELFLELAEDGDLDSMTRLAIMYFDGVGVRKNYRKSMLWDKRAAAKGSCVAMFNLAITYRARSEYVKAVYWLKKSLKYGNGDAALELAKIYMVTPKERDVSKRYLLKVISHSSVCESSVVEAERLLRSRFFTKRGE